MPTTVLNGLASRGGLSNWVMFLRPQEVVLCDVGIGPALAMGVSAGMGVMTGPGAPPPSDEVEAACEALCKTAKAIVRVENERVARVRLVKSFMPHTLKLVEVDGTEREFGFLDRPFSQGVEVPLTARFGERLEIVKTGPYAFFERNMPFMLK